MLTAPATHARRLLTAARRGAPPPPGRSCSARAMATTASSEKTYEAFRVIIKDKVAHIQLNRPTALNAMNRAFWNELPQIVQEVSE